MYEIKRSALVQYSAEQMYNLVNDVAQYDKFLPWCGGSRIQSQRDNKMIASVDIAFHGLKKTFTTENTQTPHNELQMHLVEGPFSHLTGVWHFKDLGAQGSRISLELQFDFDNFLLRKVVAPVFSKIADSMVDSFCQRAQQVYST